jgi:hypothetical protein
MLLDPGKVHPTACDALQHSKLIMIPDCIEYSYRMLEGIFHRARFSCLACPATMPRARDMKYGLRHIFVRPLRFSSSSRSTNNNWCREGSQSRLSLCDAHHHDSRSMRTKNDGKDETRSLSSSILFSVFSEQTTTSIDKTIH